MAQLKFLVESYQPTTYTRVKRSEQTHLESAVLTEQEINRLLSLYQHQQTLQEKRLVRDAIDHWLRRYHGYVIEGGIGSHYVEVGVNLRSCIFEHIVPARDALDMLLQGIMTVSQAMNIPTCLINKDNDQILRESGLGQSSPDYWLFFQRYAVLDSQFATHDGTPINPLTWTLEKHYNYFKHLVI
jgi:hypothetical protein